MDRSLFTICNACAQIEALQRVLRSHVLSFYTNVLASVFVRRIIASTPFFWGITESAGAHALPVWPNSSAAADGGATFFTRS